MKFIQDIKDLKNKTVFVRIDWNVPFIDGKIADTFRIEKSLPTIEYLLKAGAKVVLGAHIDTEGASIETLHVEAKSKFVKQLKLLKTFDATERGEAFIDSPILLLPNLRDDVGEKTNSEEFAKKLAEGVDFYINEAFSVSHREHASVNALPKMLDSYVGFQFQKEIEHLSKAFNPKSPSLFILGGLKYSTKVPLISKFEKVYNELFIGGAIANNFLRAEGKQIGSSVYEEGKFHELDLIQGNLSFPIDAIFYSKNSETDRSGDIETILPDEMIIDAGPKTLSKLIRQISVAKFIVWNGPLGDYTKGYDKGTLAIGQAIAESGAFSIVGGGDSVAVLNKAGLLDKFSFVSTGGGAMLDYLADGKLPGIDALNISTD